MSGPRLSIIPRPAIIDTRLTATALRVLCILGSHTDSDGWCSRSQGRVGDELGCSRSAVNAAIKKLVECGYVQQRALLRKDGGDRSHEYRVLLDDLQPSEFINDADDLAVEAAGDMTADATPCQIADTPLSAQNEHGGVSSGLTPNRTIPFSSERKEREARGARRDGGRKETAGEQARRIASEAWADARFIASAWRAWPDTATEVISRTYPAWLALTADEQAEAIAALPTAVAAIRAGRKKERRRLFNYLEEKAWKNFPAAAGGAGLAPVMLRPGSDFWWAEFWRRAAAGEPVRFMFDQAFPDDRRDPVGVGIQPSAMPSDASVAGLVAIPVRDGEGASAEFAAWSEYMGQRFGLRRFNHVDLRNPFIKVPSRWPPGHGQAMARAG